MSNYSTFLGCFALCSWPGSFFSIRYIEVIHFCGNFARQWSVNAKWIKRSRFFCPSSETRRKKFQVFFWIFKTQQLNPRLPRFLTYFRDLSHKYLEQRISLWRHNSSQFKVGTNAGQARIHSRTQCYYDNALVLFLSYNIHVISR